MSQSSWQIGRPDLNASFLFFFFFFFFFWAADVSDLSRSQLWNMELDFGWTRYKTEHRVEEVCCSKCFIVSVISFLVYFDKQVHKKLEKKLSKQKNSNLKFCWIKRAPKNKCAYPIMHRVWRPIYGYLWRNAVSDQCLHWKYFTFATIHGRKHVRN